VRKTKCARNFGLCIFSDFRFSVVIAGISDVPSDMFPSFEKYSGLRSFLQGVRPRLGTRGCECGFMDKRLMRLIWKDDDLDYLLIQRESERDYDP
jgi:hypothetical protein